MTIRVLLAEPEALLLEIYTHFLIGQGFEVATSSGCDCIAKLHDWQPDVVVLEPEMADGLGDRILTEAYRDSRVAVIILTRGALSPAIQQKCDCHIKPFRMSALADSIRAIVQSRGGRA